MRGAKYPRGINFVKKRYNFPLPPQTCARSNYEMTSVTNITDTRPTACILNNVTWGEARMIDHADYLAREGDGRQTFVICFIYRIIYLRDANSPVASFETTIYDIKPVTSSGEPVTRSVRRLIVVARTKPQRFPPIFVLTKSTRFLSPPSRLLFSRHSLPASRATALSKIANPFYYS